MLFESFNITIAYKDLLCEFDIREISQLEERRSFEVVQGGIAIMFLIKERDEWLMHVIEDVHPIVKHDVQSFVSQELVDLLISAIINYFDCFTNRKLIKK